MIRVLLKIGLVRRRDDGSIRWPFHVAPAWMWRQPLRTARAWGWFYVFRNLPGVIKWEPGRLLPRRWGFGIMGLIEVGSRG